MARPKKNLLKRLGIIAAILGGVQLAYIGYFYFNKKEPRSLKDAINQEVDKRNDLTPQRREKLRIQIALANYKSKNGGKPPGSLNELVPTFLDIVPIDPDTNEPFEYQVQGGKYRLGKGEVAVALAGAAGTTAITADEQTMLIDSLTKPSHGTLKVYDPSGKRDPFLPFDFSPKKENDEELTPLERFNIGQLKLTAVLKGFDEPKAIVEDQAGKGYTVQKGTKIGTDNGEVIEIQDDKLLILEKTIDFTGEEKTRTVELKMVKKSGLKGVRINSNAGTSGE